ncbi:MULTISPECIES: L-serine ammonia-lyase, iron-sulfur-dependent subunit beta [Enterococcus]|uniref:L-serine deaminase n=1 Tax=Enterococcus alishanensis TaxID=1303817 RepID=A0ABS6TF37_9ENTE|nr:L-serine ammonia-lyase, iron-sulfur-dependent subunit beta [Enterococcus alishanensis]MBV7391529.1 L-serine ammonia-lyase, iron-sulfur-dependent subunit beta [Enterococcus alishanensis]
MEVLKFRSVFDIIGPVMVGPSSSHTAGAARIGKVARMIYGEQPDSIEFDLYESFAKTYRGHGTDVALVGGILGMDPDDPRLSDSLKIAHERGMEVLFVPKKEISNHPNTVTVTMIKGDYKMSITGVSIGGGNIEITELNGYSISLSTGVPTYIIMHKDVPGLLAKISTIFLAQGLNIGKATMTRQTKGDNGIILLEVDDTPENPEQLRQDLKSVDNVISVTYYK